VDEDNGARANDRRTAQAWREFQAHLADRLADLPADDVLVVDVLVGHEPDEGVAPYVQFCAWGEGMLRGEVASDHVLAPPYALHAGGEQRLLALGYDAPTYGIDDEADSGSLNFHVARLLARRPRGAVMATRALLRRPFASAIAEAMEREREEFARRLDSAEAREAMTAVLEKRPPDFSKL